MEIFGVGTSEFIFILLIAIIVMGPKQMKEAGRIIGRWLNRITQSDLWKIFRDTSQELSNLPRKWMREANMEVWEAEQELRNTIDPRPRKPASPPMQSQPKPKSFQQAPPPESATDSHTDEKGKESPSAPND